MNQPLDRGSELTSEQLLVIRELVGDEIAQGDLPALEAAYRDYRTGMDELKASFEQLTDASDQACAPHAEATP